MPNGQRVLITAGASGLGAAVARAFLESGARVHICDVDTTAIAELERNLPKVSASVADVGEVAAVDRLFADVEQCLGGLDVLVNNAGIAGPTARLEDVEPADWQATMRINVDGQYLCARRAIPMLKTAGGGSIVNISSTAGIMGYPLRSPYVASKWAVVGLTKTLAMELGPFAIRANAICPGALTGDRMDRVIASQAAATGVAAATIREGYTRSASMRCFIEPEEVASMILFLCSDAGGKVSGQIISVDGHTESLVS